MILSKYAFRCLMLIPILFGTNLPNAESLWDFNTSAVNSDKWKCKFCLEQNDWFGALDLGLAFISADDLHFQNQFGVDDSTGALVINGEVKKWSEKGHYLSVYGKDLSRETTLVGLTKGQWKNYQLTLSFQELEITDRNALSPFRSQGNHRLNLPLGWIAAGTSQKLSTTDLHSVVLGSQRKRVALDFKKRFNQGAWRTEINYQQEEKNASRLFNGNILTYVSQLPQTIDETHTQVSASLSYHRENWQLALSYYGSVFDNKISSIQWENPFTTLGSNGANMGQSATAPDNRFQKITLSGSYHRPRIQLRSTISAGQQTQDQNFLPYAVNPNLTTTDLPSSNANAKVDTLNSHFRLLYRLQSNWRFIANYRYDDRKNRTNQINFLPVSSDSLPAIAHLKNTPYDSTNEKLDVESVWRIDRNIKMSVGYDRREKKRSFQERKKTEENKLWAKLSMRYWREGQLKLMIADSNRNGSDYQSLNDNFSQNILLRKFTLADRDRLESSLSYHHTPPGPWNANLKLRSARDDYGNTTLGLTDSLDKSIDLAINYRINDKIAVNLYTQRRWIESELLGSNSFSLPDWKGTNNDEIHTAGIGLILDSLIEDKLSASLDYIYSFSRGETSSSPLQTVSIDSFSDVTVLQHRIESKLNYRLSENTDLHFLINYQRYQDSDWHIDDIEVSGIDNVLDAGLMSFNYNGFYFSSSVEYRF